MLKMREENHRSCLCVALIDSPGVTYVLQQQQQQYNSDLLSLSNPNQLGDCLISASVTSSLNRNLNVFQFHKIIWIMNTIN
jgi:hypothetical protein